MNFKDECEWVWSTDARLGIFFPEMAANRPCHSSHGLTSPHVRHISTLSADENRYFLLTGASLLAALAKFPLVVSEFGAEHAVPEKDHVWVLLATERPRQKSSIGPVR